MNDDTPTQSSDRLDEIIAEYLQAEETGKAPPPEELLSAHPDLADELREFFANREQVHGLAAGLPTGPWMAGGVTVEGACRWTKLCRTIS